LSLIRYTIEVDKKQSKTKTKSIRPFSKYYNINDSYITARLKLLVMDLLLSNSYENTAKKMSIHHGVLLGKSQVKRILREEEKELNNFLLMLEKDNKIINFSDMILQIDGFSTRFLIHDKKIPIGKEGRYTTGLKEIKHAIIRTQGSITPKHSIKQYIDTQYTREAYKEELERLLKSNGLSKKSRVFVLADGAPWIKKIIDYLFMNKKNKHYFLIDWYHLSEYINNAVKNISGLSKKERKEYVKRWEDYAYNGFITKITDEIEENNLIKKAITLIVNNQKVNHVKNLYSYISNKTGLKENQFDYPFYRENNMPEGSGEVEGGNKLYKFRMGDQKTGALKEQKRY
jgi:hypothetical protein